MWVYIASKQLTPTALSVKQTVYKFQLRQKCRISGRSLRASRLRATNLSEVSSFSAFITHSIPSRTTASEVIRASTEKHFFFWTAATVDSSLVNASSDVGTAVCCSNASVLRRFSNRRSYRLRINGGLLLRTFERISLFTRCFERKSHFLKVSGGCPGSLDQ